MSHAVTVVARTVRSVPHRSASATWDLIVELIAPDPTADARRELTLIAGTACSCIADEALADDALVVYGAGPRVRVHALYGDDAIDGDAAHESPLSFVPTDGDWRMSIPCDAEDLPWVRRSLAGISKRFAARALGENVSHEPGKEDDGTSASAALRPSAPVVDRSAFFRR